MTKFFNRLTQPSRGLLLQLFLIIILPLTALLIVFTFGSISLHQMAMRSLVGERDERAVRTAAAGISNEISNRLEAIRGLSLQATSDLPTDLTNILSRSDYLLSNFEYGLAFFNRDGRLIAYTGDQALWKGLSSSGESPLPLMLRDANPQGSISKGFLFPGIAKPVVLSVAAAPSINPQTEPVAVGAFSPEALVQKTLSEAFMSGGQTTVLVIDSNDQVIFLNGTLGFGENPGSHKGVAEALQGETGTAYIKVGNDEHVVAYSPINPIGWGLVAEESWETVVNPTLRTTQIAPLVLIPVLLVVLVALWFGVRQVIQPLQTLETKAAQVAWGNYQAIEKSAGGITEIRHLQSELIHLVHKVQAAQQSLHGYIGAITEGQEEERRRLARDIHDDTIQSLIALKQRIQLAHMTLENGSGRDNLSIANSMGELEILTEQAIENLRRVTRALRPIYLEDLGLVAALEMLAREVSQAIPASVSFSHLGTERRFSPTVELALYRIAQEALNNILHHAEATQVSVSISFSSRETVLKVIDNGKGFVVPKSPAEFAPSGHYGLLGLHERAELIKATLEIQSGPGQGTQLVVTLSTPQNHSAEN